MSEELVALIAKRFISRRDVKAKQMPDGEYQPHRIRVNDELVDQGWKRSDLEAHLLGQATYGHYMLNHDNKVKLFAFDIDLEKTGWLPDSVGWDGSQDIKIDFYEANPREAWRDRSNPGRNWMKVQFRLMADKLAGTIHKTLDTPVAVAYSGYKGIHVYGFLPEPTPAQEAREGALLALNSLGEFDLVQGSSCYKHVNQEPDGYPNLSVEVYPKQGATTNYGNLMRMPLGRNLKAPNDPTFFVDMTQPPVILKPMNPVRALTECNPWADQ